MKLTIFIDISKLITICLVVFFIVQFTNNPIKLPEEKEEKLIKNKIVGENFFIIESSNLETISSYMYGFSISEKGVITNNYYKKLDNYEEPEPSGAFVFVKRKGNIIKISQDYLGSFGIYSYKNKKTDYFALSNSFLLLAEHLIGKQAMTFNKDYADFLIITGIASFSTYETLIKEIEKIPPNTFVVIDIVQKKYEINYIDQKLNTIPFESEEGLKLIDKWVDKWGYILRSLKKKTNNISMDLTGGFDTRTLFSIVYNSGINLNHIFINSFNDSFPIHSEDFRIASNISSKFGFKLNQNNLDNKGTLWDVKHSLDCTMYTKLGFHKEFYLKHKFFDKPRFSFTGAWGEMLRGYPNLSIQNYIKKELSLTKTIRAYEKEFYNSSKRIIKRSIKMLKTEKKYNNDYELSMALYLRARGLYHFGKTKVESFLANIYRLDPLSDPDIAKLKFNVSGQTFHDLIAYIYIRFAHDLIYIPIEGNRYIIKESIEKAKKLNNKILSYKIRSDYNKNFFIDNDRKSPIPPSKNKFKPNSYLIEILKAEKFMITLNKIYNNSVYNFAREYSKKTKYFPLKHGYALLAIVKILDLLELNKKKLRKLKII